MSKVCLAILAHNNRPCLEDFLLNVQTFEPDADVLLFNGGKDPGLAQGLDIEVCPYSRPLAYSRVARFHFEIIRWLNEQRRNYDFLVTLDSDMLFLKRGLGGYLETHMGNSAYMGVNFHEVPPWTKWVAGRRYHLKWKHLWQPIFATKNPYGVFNPGQVFRKEYGDKLLRFPRLDELLNRIDRSSMTNLDEMVWATMAVTLDCAPMRPPSAVERAVRYLKPHSLAEIRTYLDDPDIFFIHPATMDLHAPERELIRLIRAGSPVDLTSFEPRFDSFTPQVSLGKRLSMSLAAPVLSRARDAYLRVVRE